MKKQFLSFVFLFIFASFYPLFSQSNFNSNYVKSLREATICFENKDYGKALILAENAIREKKEQHTKEVEKLERTLASREVRKAGDDLSKVLKALYERDENDIANIIEFYISKKGKTFFNNSVKSMIEYIKTLKEYPEAKKLIGDIYKIEGEFTLAQDFYLQALEYSDVLNVNDEKYTILYLLADISRLLADDNSYETRLLNIASTQSLEKRNILVNSMSSLIKKDKKDTINKFFDMYRFDDYYSLNAYCQLAEFYKEKALYDKALGFSALAVITGFSKMDYVISKRDLTYEYKDLASFLEDVSNHYDLVEWADQNNIWKSFDLLCEISNLCGSTVFSSDLLKVLARYCPSEYWRNSAVIKLDSVKN